MKRKQFSKLERMVVYNKTHGCCGYCGCNLQLNQMQIDHIIPLAHGGTNDEGNLMASCRSCNHRKGTSSLKRFRKQVEKFPEVLMRDSVTYRNAVRFGLVVPKSGKVVFYFEKLEEAQ